MNSILSFENRGPWGNAKYRGNCSGYVIRELLQHFKPKTFLEVFSGGGTGRDVAQELGYKNSIHLDLNTGWNALTDDIPSGNDFTFSHPPYWDIINYNKVRQQENQDDLSNVMSYEEFIVKLDKVNAKIYQALVNGGRHAFLVGDVRKSGQYFSIIKDMTWIGDMEAHLIKAQHNTVSSRKKYNSNFIPITHEHLLIFKKREIWTVPLKITKTQTFDLRAFENMTWRDFIQAALEHLGGQSDLKSIYTIIEESHKAKKNKHWKEKVRQTLQINQNFEPIDRGVWKLSVA